MAVIELVKIESWPALTLSVPEGFHALLWFVMIMSVLVLVFCTLISGTIVIYGTWYLVKYKCSVPEWNVVRHMLGSFFKRGNEDQSDSGGIISSDILNEANRTIDGMQSIGY